MAPPRAVNSVRQNAIDAQISERLEVEQDLEESIASAYVPTTLPIMTADINRRGRGHERSECLSAASRRFRSKPRILIELANIIDRDLFDRQLARESP